jgi:hypothetical protein
MLVIATEHTEYTERSGHKKHKRRKNRNAGLSCAFCAFCGYSVIMDCRPNCGACCIAPSISSPIPGMPHGKPAGMRCVQLLPDYRCALFGKPDRPAVCASLRPSETMCGATRDEALVHLDGLELATRPGA